MGLTVRQGRAHDADKEVMLYAFQHAPALILDCANRADPHALFPAVSAEQFSEVFVLEIDLLYSFRDALKRVPEFMRRLKARTLVITSSHHLFHYQDDEENRNVLAHAWELIEELSKEMEVVVAQVGPGQPASAARRGGGRWDTRSRVSG